MRDHGLKHGPRFAEGAVTFKRNLLPIIVMSGVDHDQGALPFFADNFVRSVLWGDMMPTRVGAYNVTGDKWSADLIGDPMAFDRPMLKFKLLSECEPQPSLSTGARILLKKAHLRDFKQREMKEFESSRQFIPLARAILHLPHDSHDPADDAQFAVIGRFRWYTRIV